VDLGTDYLELALALGRLVPDWIDSYVGPPDLADTVAGREDIDAAELRERVDSFAQKVAEQEPDADRREWLLAQLRAISSAARWLTGPSLDYAQRFETCHGASVERVPERQFETAYALLDSSLPPGGSIQTRYRSWRERQLVPRARLQEGIDVLTEQMRRRSHEMFDLPDDENVTWDLVSGEPWAGYAEYLGQRRTLVRINTDFPISSPRLLELVCHEAYPGHHTESVCKDASLIYAARRREMCVFVLPTPQALVSEGIGCLALEALLGNEAETIAADCLRTVGITYDHVTAAAVRKAEVLLLPVRSNIAMMIDGGSTPAGVREYARTWMLDEPEQIEQEVVNLERRSWLPYESCYPVGLELCHRYTAGSPERFNELLHRQLTPANLGGQADG
jgi:hypothetical protein